MSKIEEVFFFKIPDEQKSIFTLSMQLHYKTQMCGSYIWIFTDKISKIALKSH